VDLIAEGLCATAAMPMVFGLTLTWPTFVFSLLFFQAYVSLLRASVRLALGLV